MSDHDHPPSSLAHQRFYQAEQEAGFVESHPRVSPQQQDPAYRLAFRDTDFLLRQELRPVRFQLELLKPEMLLDEAGIASTLVVYGSARIPAPEHAQDMLDQATTPQARAIAERLAAKARHYDEARRLARLAANANVIEKGKRHFVVCSGGGPSIMEAANRGASEGGGETIGLNITLRHEQEPNPFVTPHLSFQFHYFALRKMHFLLRARAVAVFPGGFGTFDEFFELLTLIQTGKMQPIPVLLFGGDYWDRVINFNAIAEEGLIGFADLDLFRRVETAEEAWQEIVDFYALETGD
ncbi:LOG family protein [Novosphingobium acidiphilum]|uniref:LOG family protein n=1 Tax=Novosphingobium acidiphilum TaxID=505248 RepID=UPI0004188326|nr:LOG family protein [Novosphingobium acidiphilum]